MVDGEVDSLNSCGLLDEYFLDTSSFVQSDWETIIGTQICSHKHICNPTTGPDNTHTHTCEHTHTQTIGSEDDEGKLLTKKRRPSGNKEAVRKYREKQKAVKVNLGVRNAELEKENRHLEVRNAELEKEIHGLRRKLFEQGPKQDVLENVILENKRLRSLLSKIRREIDSELDEGVNYNTKFLFNAAATTKVVRSAAPSSGFYAPAVCAAPPPCFLPSGGAHIAAVSMSEVDRAESLGWHAECELGNNSTMCHSPDSDDGDTTDKCTSFGSLPPSSKSTAATSRQRRNNASLQAVPVASHLAAAPCGARVPCVNRTVRGGAATEASTQGGGELSVSASRWPGGNCENLVNDSSLKADITAEASQPGGELNRNASRWQGNCENLVNGTTLDVEMTADSESTTLGGCVSHCQHSPSSSKLGL